MNALRQIKSLMKENCFLGGASAILQDTKALVDKEMPMYILIATGCSLIVLFLSLKETIVPLIFILVLGFAIYFRRRSPDEIGRNAKGSATALEVTWTLIPLGILLFLFVWGTQIYFDAVRPPADAIQYYVIGRQWMWKIQHPDGHREINEGIGGNASLRAAGHTCNQE